MGDKRAARLAEQLAAEYQAEQGFDDRLYALEAIAEKYFLRLETPASGAAPQPPDQRRAVLLEVLDAVAKVRADSWPSSRQSLNDLAEYHEKVLGVLRDLADNAPALTAPASGKREVAQTRLDEAEWWVALVPNGVSRTLELQRDMRITVLRAALEAAAAEPK